MPRLPGPAMNMTSRSVSVIRDAQGEIIAVLGMEDLTVLDPVRGALRYRANDSFQLVCGTIYHPMMSMGKEPVVLLAVCDDCRSPKRCGERPRHGLCSRERGSACVSCQRFLCPAHTTKCSDDQVRCGECARKHSIKTAFWSIFFRRKEE